MTDRSRGLSFEAIIDPLIRTRRILLGLAWLTGVVVLPLMLAASAYGQAATNPPSPPSRLDIEPDLNRWRILEPQGIGEKPRNPLYDPYTPNILKGDYPLFGDKVFFAATGVLDMFADYKRNLDFRPRINNVSFHRENMLGQLTAVAALEIFQGDTVFTPKDWAVRVAPVIRYRCGDKNAIDQGCGEYITLQEAFGELKLFEIGETFDATSARLGLQGFNSDFFGLIYNDVQPGFRVFSEIARNQFKVNVAGFDRLNKEKLSALNELDKRRQHQVGIVNLEWDDFILPGFNILPSVVVNHDDAPGVANGKGGSLDAVYVGVTTNGRIDRFNVNSAFYWVGGRTANNTPTQRAQEISAGMAFVQVAYPINYFNPRFALAYATGDDKPTDKKARGFDSVFDNTAFGGGQFSYLFGEKIQLGNTTVLRGNSVFPSLRGANATSQFVNPGVLALNPGVDMTLTSKTLFEANYNYVRFDDPSSLQFALKKNNISNDVGHEINAGVTYRPFLNEQVILFAGGAVFFPGQGIKDTFGSDDTVYKAVLRLVLTF